jgi:hypothetical protein
MRARSVSRRWTSGEDLVFGWPNRRGCSSRSARSRSIRGDGSSASLVIRKPRIRWRCSPNPWPELVGCRPRSCPTGTYHHQQPHRGPQQAAQTGQTRRLRVEEPLSFPLAAHDSTAPHPVGRNTESDLVGMRKLKTRLISSGAAEDDKHGGQGDSEITEHRPILNVRLVQAHGIVPRQI